MADDPKKPNLVERILERSVVFAQHIDTSLVHIADNSHEDNGAISDETVSSIIVALIMHANCYTRALQERGATEIHMEALTKLAGKMSDEVYDAYEANINGQVTVKGPEEAQ